MNQQLYEFIVYVLPGLVVFACYLYLRRRKFLAATKMLQEMTEAGMLEPPSLHPVINHDRCIGSATCVRACPEDAIGIIGGKAYLVNPAHCIGHGACLPACPTEAIQLVFGTAKRGIDIPQVLPNFESNVPGVYIAGELGGMGLIRKAAEQGKQAMDSIKKNVARASGDFIDVLIVGAGPAGLAAGLGAIEHGLKYKLIEQEDSHGGTVYHYPRNKIAMTAPVKLPIIGKVKMTEVQKEWLLQFWNDVIAKVKLEILYRQRMEGIEQCEGGFAVKTQSATYKTRSILLAIGRRGTPRKLGVPGEDSAKVVYRLIDAEQYRGKKVMVVGGGDSAVEAAIALADQPDTDVSISYRSDAFSRIKEKNRQMLEERKNNNKIKVMLKTNIASIEESQVIMKGNPDPIKLPNDIVIVSAGGELPTALMKSIGIMFETKHGEL